jgi:hypothetical protein
LEGSRDHRSLETIELTVRQVTHTKRVTDAAEKHGGIVDPGAMRGDVAEGQGVTVIFRFLKKDCMLLLLVLDSGLIGA